MLVGAVASCGGGGGNGTQTGTVSIGTQWLPSDVTKACAMAVSCVSPALTSSAGQCAYALERSVVTGTGDPAFEGFVKCAKTATDCTAALSCASLGHGPDYCSSHAESSCDGDLVIDCFPLTKPQWTVTIPPIDCRAYGMTCLNGMCTDGKTCDDQIVSQCLPGGTVIRGCDQLTKMEYRTDCRLIYPGGVCDVSTLEPVCAPPQRGQCASPSATSYSSCQGDILSGCQGLLDIKLDCSKMASRCGPDDQGFADCVPDATDCKRDAPDRCNGPKLEFCQDGAWQDFDCASVGLGPCGTIDGGGVACGAG